MKSVVSTAFLKVPLIVIGVVVLCLGVSFVLTDPAPSTLPRRVRHLHAAISAMWSSPPGLYRPPRLSTYPS